MQRWIVAMGGGGFSMEAGRSRLDEEVLRLAAQRRGRERPRVCFIATASGDDAGYVGRFHAAFGERAETSHLDLLNERSVNEAVKAMKLTRIIVAHRPETIAMADRVVVLDQGRVVRDFAANTGGAAHNGMAHP